MFGPALLGALLVNKLPSHLKVGLLFSYWISIFMFTPFVILLGWIPAIVAGNTKRRYCFTTVWRLSAERKHIIGTTVNAMILSGYSIGNIAGPFVWKKKYQPRYATAFNKSDILVLMSPSIFVNSNHVPWTLIAACIGTCTILILILRVMLRAENKRRDAEQRDDTFDNVYIKEELADGTKIEKYVDKVGTLLCYSLERRIFSLTCHTGLPWPYWHPKSRLPLWSLMNLLLSAFQSDIYRVHTRQDCNDGRIPRDIVLDLSLSSN